jgi:hypothetical protein
MMNIELLKTIKILKKFNKDFKNKKHRIVSMNNVFISDYLYFFHFATYKKLYKNPYRDILINYFKRAECIFPGSSLDLCESLVEKFLDKNKVKNTKIVDKNKKNLKKFLLQSSKSEVVENFLNILEFSGPDAVLNCNITKNSIFKVHKSVNPVFKISLEEEFKSVFFKNQDSLTKDYLVCLYDGFIERESEVNSLIEKSINNNNIPIVLVCRGISHYAVKNLKKMILTQKIQILPYICKFDNNDPFIFEDLEKTIGVKGYKLESGDNLYKKLSENSNVVKLKLKSNSIEISESLGELLKKEITNSLINVDNSDISLKKYLYKRKNRCSPNIVYIEIPETSVNLLNEYKSLIKCYNYIAKSGLLEINGKLYSYYSYNKTNILSRKLFETLNNIGLTIKIKEK